VTGSRASAGKPSPILNEEVATLALIGLVFVALGLFTSPFGVLIAGAIAPAVGVGMGVDDRHHRLSLHST
jgi:hypothetical protein